MRALASIPGIIEENVKKFSNFIFRLFRARFSGEAGDDAPTSLCEGELRGMIFRGVGGGGGQFRAR